MFENNLKAVRKAKGKTQQEIADIIGITQNAYSYWESGKVRINSESIAVLAEYYGISVDFLLGRRYKMRKLPNKWDDSLREDYEKADENVKKYMEAKYGDIIFVDSEEVSTNGDDNADELLEYLEQLKNRPEMRMLFSLAKGATKEDVDKAIAIIKALKNVENE